MHGIQVGASNISSVNLVSVFTGNISNAGTISAGGTGIAVSRVARFGTSSADSYIVNTGVISAANGVTVDQCRDLLRWHQKQWHDSSGRAFCGLGPYSPYSSLVVRVDTLSGDAAIDNVGTLLATGTSVVVDNVSTLFGGIQE